MADHDPCARPVSPLNAEDLHHLSLDSMTSITLSDSSLDDDRRLSAHQNEDVLATPRVQGVSHRRKPSSLDILHNTWAEPRRQSTFFDNDKEVALGGSMSAIDTERETWLRDSLNVRSPPLLVTVDTTGNAHHQAPQEVIDDLAEFGELVSARPVSTISPSSSVSSVSSPSGGVNWLALDASESQEKTDRDLPDGAEDDAAAFLLARLEQENAKFTADPKSAVHQAVARARANSMRPSVNQLKRLVSQQVGTPSIRYSHASTVDARSILDNSITEEHQIQEPPAMTELEFWAALVQDYPSTAVRLPTLTTTKIRSGVPPPLRGVVWTSISGARDTHLEAAYEKLLGERSPYEGIINKDVGRSFPGVELFRDAEGEGQKMLGRVLKCFSLQDEEIGYCQGLGFLVGPLLMNMGEREAFCVLVR
jgi:hypothetical protein